MAGIRCFFCIFEFLTNLKTFDYKIFTYEIIYYFEQTSTKNNQN